MKNKQLRSIFESVRIVDALMPPVQGAPVPSPVPEPVEEVKYGFVCPDWAFPHWDPLECEIYPATDGSHVVVDHGVQTAVFVGRDERVCRDFLRTQS